MAKEQKKDARTLMEQFYDTQLREIVDQKDEEVREQVQAAFDEPPATPDDVDPWFIKHFHAAPLSHDIPLYNALHAMKAQLREIAGQQLQAEA